jgi:hypothetical protein
VTSYSLPNGGSMFAAAEVGELLVVPAPAKRVPGCRPSALVVAGAPVAAARRSDDVTRAAVTRRSAP